MTLKAFKAYDIRGVYGQDITEDLACKVGRCLPATLACRDFFVGRDARLSSPALAEALIRGLREAGADVTDLGLCTTPMTYFMNAKSEGASASVMVTASHNPPEYNGLKVSKPDARPCGYDQGLREVEAMIVENRIPPPAARAGTLRDAGQACHAEYLAWLRARTPDLAGLRFAVDCSNGATGVFARDLFGAADRLLNAEPDGTFPNHGPDPLQPANRARLAECVRANGLDLGVLFDGDGDRVAFVDATGAFIPPDALLPAFAEALRPQCPDAAPVVVHDVRTSRGVIETLRERGFVPHMVKVGAAFAKTALRDLNGICGGEVAGHYYFRAFHWNDSGLLAALLALGVFALAKRNGLAAADLLAPITGRYVASGEINIPGVDDRPAAVARVEAAVTALMGPPQTRIDYDGIRLDWPDAWLGARPSNTEPVLRLAAEAKGRPTLERLLAAAKAAALPA